MLIQAVYPILVKWLAHMVFPAEVPPPEVEKPDLT
jgi:hypothetical protein